jgi:hypothetical protein
MAKEELHKLAGDDVRAVAACVHHSEHIGRALMTGICGICGMVREVREVSGVIICEGCCRG